MSQKNDEMIHQLFRAFTELSSTEDKRVLRVLDISRAAGVHRATFYRYVEGVQDLLERGTQLFWDRLLREVEQKRKEAAPTPPGGELPAYLVLFFQRIRENASVFRTFMHRDVSNYFQVHSRKRMVRFIEQNRLLYGKDPVLRHHLACMVAASLYATIELLTEEEADASSALFYRKVYYAFVGHVREIQRRMDNSTLSGHEFF